MIGTIALLTLEKEVVHRSPPALSRCELRRRMPVAESAVAVIGRTPDPFQPLPARSTSEFGSIHKRAIAATNRAATARKTIIVRIILRFISNNKRAFRKFHIPSRRTVSKIIRKTGNPPHRNGINRHHAAEKPQDVPPICIPGRLPLSLQTPIGLSPLFRKSGNRHPAPKSCASPTQSETGYLLPSPRAEPYPLPSESGHRPDSNPFHTFLLWQNSKDSSSTARPRRPAAK